MQYYHRWRSLVQLVTMNKLTVVTNDFVIADYLMDGQRLHNYLTLAGRYAGKTGRASVKPRRRFCAG